MSSASSPLRLSAHDRKQQIVSRAIHLFAARGFNGVTTREIADAAQVNEAILFRHFPSKQELYWAVIDEKCRQTARDEELRERLRQCSRQDDRTVFSALAADILKRNYRDPNLSRLLFFAALENHELTERFFERHVADFYRILSGHIQQRIKEGAFRKLDPMLAARGFVGMVFHQFLIQELFGGKYHMKLDQEKVCDDLADIWLRGVIADEAGAKKPKLTSKKLISRANGNKTHA